MVFNYYTAGWNMTGCLCDSEPMVFETQEDAKQSIIDYLLSWANSEEDENIAEELTSTAEFVNLESSEFSVFVPCVGYWFWIAGQYGEMPRDYC